MPAGRRRVRKPGGRVGIVLLETLRTFNGVFTNYFGNSVILYGRQIASCHPSAAEGIGGLMFQIKEGVRIENPREYESAAVENLRLLIQGGGLAQRDPQRENFYEIEGNGETYYIHVSPVNGNVVLLAKWLRQSEECCLTASNLVA